MYVGPSRLGMLIFCICGARWKYWHTYTAASMLSLGLSARVLEYDGLICTTRMIDNDPTKDEGDRM